MNIDELKQLFTEAFNNPIIKTPIVRPPGKPKSNQSFTHHLYPIKALQALIDVLKGLDEYDDDNERFSVRYIVLKDGKLLLAREGAPCSTIPAHREMSMQSIAAGNIYFSHDYQMITKINHQSGDFHSTQGSMIWPLAAILLSNVALSPSFTLDISNVNSNGEFITESLLDNLTIDNLFDLLPVGIMEIVEAANIDEAIVIKSFTDPRKRRFDVTFWGSMDDEPAPLSLPPVVTGPIVYNTPPITPRV